MAERSDQTNFDSLIGRLVVSRGLATADEVQRIEQQLQSDEDNANQQSIADRLVVEGVVTQSQIDRIRPEAESQRRGQQIPGYQILSKLGAGAMATVYKAKQISLDREVAIKVLPQKFTSNPDFVRRFYDEGRAAGKLNHPNIVGALDVNEANGYHYFVMEYVEGHTVFDHLQKQGRYSEQEALNIAIDTAKALEHAHKAGFIHRDVKPKNIMITKSGTAKLADMGLARAVSDREAAEQEQGKAFGTPYYISPEQIRGEMNVDFRADIYGFGATLYHMVTGQVPYEAPNPSAVMAKHLKAELTPPDHINSQLSTGLCEIIEVCMQKDREKRYDDTSELLEDLQAVAKGESPTRARRRFDISSLAALEDASGQTQAVEAQDLSESVSLLEQPVFWAAVCGWVAALIMTIVAIVLATM